MAAASDDVVALPAEVESPAAAPAPAAALSPARTSQKNAIAIDSPTAALAPVADALPAQTSQENAGAIENPTSAPAPAADTSPPAQTSEEKAPAIESPRAAIAPAADASPGETSLENAGAVEDPTPAPTPAADAALAQASHENAGAPAADASPAETSLEDTAAIESPMATPALAADAAPAEAARKETAECAGSAADPSAGAAESLEQKPKKPATAYWLFSQHMREQATKMLKDQNDGKATFGEIAKEVSARWAALTDAGRREFEEKASLDKQRYQTELLAYQEACDPVAAMKRKYEHLIPKRPASAYARFCQDPAVRQRATEAVTATGQTATSRLLTAKLSDIWKAATSGEKGPFQDAHVEEHGLFLKRQRTWQETPEYAELQKAEHEQEERRKAAEAAEAARLRREKLAARRAAKSEAGKGAAQQTPQKQQARKGAAAEATPKTKRSASESTTPASKVKRARRSPKGVAVAAAVDLGPQIDEKVLAEASRLGLEAALRNLASRPEVVAATKSSAEILAALQTSGGLVNPAKRALVGS